MTAPTCDQCMGNLFACDLLSNLTTCAECSRKALRASRRGTRPMAVDEWATFTAALREVAAAHGGEVDWTFVRPLIRGRVQHKHVGQLVKRARRERLLVEVDHRRSEDRAGKNAGRMEPLYRIGAAA